MNKFSFLTLFIVFLLMGCGSRVRQDQAEYSEADQQLLAAAQRYFNQLPEPKDPNTPLALLGKSYITKKHYLPMGR